MQKFSFLFLFVFVVTFSVNAQNQWFTDNDMKFKIQVPSDYSKNQMQDGTDRVLTIMSPDQNVFVRVRAMAANNQFTNDLLQQAFEQNMIQGAQRLMNEDGDLHGIPARASAYTWSVDGSDAVLAVYYIIQNGFAYVVWAAVPQAQAQQYSATADGIIESFDLIQATESKQGGLMSSLSQQATPPPSANKDYVEMLSHDACIEHFIPNGYQVTSQEEGQMIFEDGSGIKVIQQVLFKQGQFKPYMEDMVASISEQGADVVKKDYIVKNGLMVFQYFYTYRDTYFAYFAVENNNKYYLLGFVGDKLKQFQIVKHANHVANNVKRGYCPELAASKANSSSVKKGTLTHLGFDFSSGQKGHADGETIGWCPGGNNPNYKKGIWWRSAGTTQCKNMGNVPLSALSTIPTTWDKPSIPLLPGGTYIIKCTDGYAGVKVLSIDENHNDWPVEVEYIFTSGNSF